MGNHDHRYGLSYTSHTHLATNVANTTDMASMPPPKYTKYGGITQEQMNRYSHLSANQIIIELQRQEKEGDGMSELQRVARERRDKQERARIEKAYEAWDEVFAGDPGYLFVTHLGEGENLVGHAGILARTLKDGQQRWSVTGHLNEASTEDLMAWFIGKDLTPEDVQWHS